MRILVTGGAGFIGSHVTDRYVALGHEVAALDNLSTGQRANLNPKCRFYEMSLMDPRLEETLLQFAPDVISHHAAQVNVRRSVEDPVFDAQMNVLGSIRLFQAAAKARCAKVIYASSGGACYGEPARIPADEETPVRPLCPYGASKYAAEKYLELFGNLYGVRTTVLRYANVYGPRQDPHGEAGVVAVFSQLLLAGRSPQIFGDGTKTRDYVFVQDIVEANVLALAVGDGRVYNVGTGRQVSDDEVYRTVRDALEAKVEAVHTDFRKGEVRHIALDASRLRRELGWKPAVSFEEGMAQTAAWYRGRS
jgi:UDP-glucose 4-epimerase